MSLADERVREAYLAGFHSGETFHHPDNERAEREVDRYMEGLDA